MMDKIGEDTLHSVRNNMKRVPSETYVFDKLLQLPLLQGMGRNDVLSIAEHVKIGFIQKEKGSRIVEQGAISQSLFFVMTGDVCTVTTSPDRSYQLKEWSSLPFVIQPECLFGVQTRYLRSVYAAGEVQLLEMSKSAVRDMLFDCPTFRINFLNLVCWQSQQSTRRLWTHKAQTIDNSFIQFLLLRSLRPAGRKELKIKMTRLAEELGETRLNVSRMLHELENKGFLDSSRERIQIPAFERLVNK